MIIAIAALGVALLALWSATVEATAITLRRALELKGKAGERHDRERTGMAAVAMDRPRAKAPRDALDVFRWNDQTVTEVLASASTGGEVMGHIFIRSLVNAPAETYDALVLVPPEGEREIRAGAHELERLPVAAFGLVERPDGDRVEPMVIVPGSDSLELLRTYCERRPGRFVKLASKDVGGGAEKVAALKSLPE
jgi:hypothetical protein